MHTEAACRRYDNISMLDCVQPADNPQLLRQVTAQAFQGGGGGGSQGGVPRELT